MPTFAVVLLFALCATPLPAQERDEQRGRNLDVIIEQIGALESEADPKCHATATRLENFMFGTPLTSEARAKKVALQKSLVSAVWRHASEIATAKGLANVGAEHMREAARSALAFERRDDGSVAIDAIELSERDLRQYGSVAYALRAILAVEQEHFLNPASPFLPTDPGAIEALKELVDVHTLAVLYVADKNARVFDETEIAPSRFERAWKELGAPLARESAPSPTDTRTSERFPVLMRIVEQKVASYAAYNDVSMTLFWQNIKSYFARMGAPADEATASRFQQAFATRVVSFIADLMKRAEERAVENGARRIDASVIEAAQHREAPFEVNAYEDVVFFPRLARGERIVIESYDMDAFRDSGLHWKFLGECVRHPLYPGTLELDPFAAELVAEAAAQYGVLLFRVAGELARSEGAAMLDPVHIPRAATAIHERALEHHAAPAERSADVAIASARGDSNARAAFRDATDELGIDFMHRSSDWLSRFQRSYLYQLVPDSTDTPAAMDSPPSFSGGGVAAEDVDNDGFPDVLLVGGIANRLFLNRRGQGFDVLAGLELAREDGNFGEPRQPLIADLDNDGWQDIVITYARDDHRVFRNLGTAENGTLRFEDVSEAAGLGGRDAIAGPATVFDYDRDGLLDLYIGYFGDYTKGVRPYLIRDNINAGRNRLFRNTGGLRFEDVTEGSGAADTGWAQAATHVDFDGDGWQDLVVANDFGQNAYLKNLADGRFEDVTFDLRTDVPAHSMNVGTSDLNRDGFPDFYISNILTMMKDEKYVLPSADTPMKFNDEALSTMRVVEANHLFLSESGRGKLRSYGLSDLVKRGARSTGWAWDADFFDFDNDGDDDLYVVNGHIEYPIYDAAYYGDAELQSNFRDKESNVLFANDAGALENVSETSGADFHGNSRGAAYLDHDADGDLDIVIANFHANATFLENRTERAQGDWMSVRLEGDPARGSNRDAIGASLVLTTSTGARIWRLVQGSTGYLSAHPKTQHFGLGASTPVALRVVWPDGSEEVVTDLEAGRHHRIVQGSHY